MEVKAMHSQCWHSVHQNKAANMDSPTNTRGRPAVASQRLERPNHRGRTGTGENEGRGRGMEIGTTTRAQLSTGSDMPWNPKEQSKHDSSPTMPTATRTPDGIAPPLDTANVATRSEVRRSEISVQQVETDLTAVRTEMDTLIGKGND